MLISFTVENWMSFREQATLSMVASKERQHGDRLPRVAKYTMRVLPIAAIYGGNASGKTNFFRALNFVKSMVVKGTQPDSLIPVEPFRLDPACADQPCCFIIELFINEMVYEYSFALTRKKVVTEKLVEITSSSERVLFDRTNGRPNFDVTLGKDKFLQFAFQGTRENQLFLTNAVTQQVMLFKPIYDWFRDTLELIAPDARFGSFEPFLQEDSALYPLLNATLAQLDTGIKHIDGEEVSFDHLPLPEQFRMELIEKIKDGETVKLQLDSLNERYIVTRKGSDLIAKKLIAYHQRIDGGEVKFDMGTESDGSQRVIDLLPALLEIGSTESQKVIIIDEIDRSLHTLLTRQLLESYLSVCTGHTRSQLLFTTHDVLLMDQALLRRDEMWVTERDTAGCSTISSFSEYKDVRYDKDIRKSYLEGRLGGIPRLLICGASASGNVTDTCQEG